MKINLEIEEAPAFSTLKVESVVQNKLDDTIYVLSNINEKSGFGVMDNKKLRQTINVNLPSETEEKPEIIHFLRYTHSDFPRVDKEYIEKDKKEYEELMKMNIRRGRSNFYDYFMNFKEFFNKTNPSFLEKNFLVVEGDSDLELFYAMKKHSELEFGIEQDKPKISVTNNGMFPPKNLNQNQRNNDPQSENTNYYGSCTIL